MKSLIYIILIFILSAFFSSCEKGRVFDVFTPISSKGWSQDTTLKFEFEITEPNDLYNLSINIRNTDKYKYCNVYIKYNLKDANNQMISTGMPEMFLMDPKTGKPQGSGIGGLFTHSFVFLKNFKFNSKGKYTLELKQYMRDAVLEEVKDIGVLVQKTEK
ncbi:MAG: gliding motility lipoprotein GldH [Cytophagales bacterium]